MSKKMFLLVACVSLMLFVNTTLDAAPEKDKIRVGWVTSLSGILATAVATTTAPAYEIWLEEVNAKGGIYVKEYGKKLPVEI